MRTLYIGVRNFYDVEFTQFSSDMCTIPQKEKAYGKQIFSTMCMLLYIVFLFHNHQHSHNNTHQHLVAKEGTLPSAHS